LVLFGWTSGAIDHTHVRQRDQRTFDGDKFGGAPLLTGSDEESDE
jgi:hypothetical protein